MTLFSKLSARAEKLLGLSAEEWRWLTEAWFRLLFKTINLGVRREGWLRSQLAPTNQIPADRKTVGCSRPIRLYSMVALAARVQPLTTACLPRTLVLRDMLVGRGLPAEVVVGVARGERDIYAHSWVALHGCPVGETPETLKAFDSRGITNTVSG